MSRQRQRGFASSLVLMSVMIALMSLGSGWGEVYGQSAGPPPTPESGAGAVAPVVGGAEGEAAPARQEAVAGEEGAAAVPSQLDQTGAESSPHWLLLSIGVILFAAGALMFMRTRRAL